MNNILPNEQFIQLLKLLPSPRQKRRGRKRCKKDLLLKGILYVLKYDIPWNQLDIEGVSGTSCWRYFNKIQKQGLLKLIYKALVDKHLDICLCSLDTSTTTSFSFKDCTGWDGKHRKMGTKISALSDENGIPCDLEFGKGSKHDLKFLDKHLKNTIGKRKKVLSMDKGYTSIDMRRELRKKGIRVNMETRKGDYIHKKGPKFKVDQQIYETRFNLERTFGWMKSFDRIRIRKDRRIAMFKAFTYLAVIIVLIRSF
jgi:transposase